MADKEHDKFASIVDQCIYPSSQEDIFLHTKFVGEEEEESTVERSSGGSHEKLKGLDDSEKRDSCEFIAVCADCEEKQDLGFSEERKRSSIEADFGGELRKDEKLEVGLGEICENEGEKPPLKKSRVSGLESPTVSPLVHCTEKIVADGEDIESTTMVVNDVKVQIVSPLRCVALDSGESTEKVCSANRNDDLIGACTKKKLGFEEEEGNGAKNREIDHVENEVGNGNREDIRSGDNAVADGSEKPKGGDNQLDGTITSHATKKEGKRELPRTLLGQVWGSTAEGGEGVRNGVAGSKARQDGLDEATADVNGKGKSKAGERVKNIFDVLRILAVKARHDKNDEFDIFETAKRRGMTFPQSRFRSGTGTGTGTGTNK